MTETAVATRDNAVSQIPDRVQSEILPALMNAKALNPAFDDRMVTSFQAHLEMAFAQEPRLRECTPISIFKAVSSCIINGLLPTRDAHLVPFGKDVTLLPEAKGLVKALKRHPDIVDFQTGLVHSGDEFSDGAMFEEPYHRKSRDPNPGKFQGSYCVVLFKDRHKKCEFVSAMRLDQLRKMSRSADGPAWKGSPGEMQRAKAIQAWVSRYGHEYLSPDLIQPLMDVESAPIQLEAVTDEEEAAMIENLFGSSDKDGYQHPAMAQIQNIPTPSWPVEEPEPERLEADISEAEHQAAIDQIECLRTLYKFETRRMTAAIKLYGKDTVDELTYAEKLKLIKSMSQAGDTPQ